MKMPYTSVLSADGTNFLEPKVILLNTEAL